MIINRNPDESEAEAVLRRLNATVRFVHETGGPDGTGTGRVGDFAHVTIDHVTTVGFTTHDALLKLLEVADAIRAKGFDFPNGGAR